MLLALLLLPLACGDQLASSGSGEASVEVVARAGEATGEAWGGREPGEAGGEEVEGREVVQGQTYTYPVSAYPSDYPHPAPADYGSPASHYPAPAEYQPPAPAQYQPPAQYQSQSQYEPFPSQPLEDYPPTQYQLAETDQEHYDPATGPAYGYNYDDYSNPEELDQESESVSEKQGNPITAVTFPLGVAVLTFTAMVVTAAAFLLFPSTVEVEVNSISSSREKRDLAGHPMANSWPLADNSLATPWSLADNTLATSWPLADNSLATPWPLADNTQATPWPVPASPGQCVDSTLCQILRTLQLSQDCVEAASCEVASMANSKNFPVMANIVRPFMTQDYYKRFRDLDCSQIKCSFPKPN